MELILATTLHTLGETGVAWDRGWVGQLNFKYVPDVKIKKYFYLTK